MEQQRKAAHSGWYHETQSSQQGHLPLDPHAALAQDRFLLGQDAQLDPTLRSLIHERQGLLNASRACYDVLFPDSLKVSRTETLSLYDRLSSALTVAQVSGVQPLCSHYAARLAPLSSPDASRESNIRQTHITQFARLLATQPTLITPPMLSQLNDVGLSTQDIVTFTQLIGFVSYQARVLAILNGLRGRAAAVLPGFPSPEGCEQKGYSLAMLQWSSRLPEVAPESASQHQQDVLDLIAPDARSSSFYTLLVHNADALSEFSAVFNNIMQAGERPKAAWRELAAVATSELNGCLYCAGIHGRLYLEAEGRTELIEQLFEATYRDEVVDAVSQKQAGSAEAALLESVIALTRTPERFDARLLHGLSDAGYTATQSLDILLTAALFSWSNRLIQTLGDTVSQ
ncbi:CMD domain-containing protein [Rahnella inusitata]|uniref:Peroxidase n=1 Tax=Rahnella inusitata TaxID=58169 RepID=A0ABX9P5F0_9GAMM|nr:peroxidase-related enzyme [Rahnella inusitata]RJT16164.1 peroxidase [Rahnella inusitata]